MRRFKPTAGLILSMICCINVLSAQEHRSSAERDLEKNKSRIEELSRLIGEVKLAVLASPSLQEEMSLVPQQQEVLKPILEDHDVQWTQCCKDVAPQIKPLEEKVRSGIKLDDDENELGIWVQQRMLAILEKSRSGIDEILLPHQLKRIDQIAAQRRGLGNQGPFESLEIPLRLSSELKLDQTEIDELRNATDEARRELESRKKELKQEAWDLILAALSPEKQKEFRRLVGEIRNP